jgi:hypothetical protein
MIWLIAATSLLLGVNFHHLVLPEISRWLRRRHSSPLEPGLRSWMDQWVEDQKRTGIHGRIEINGERWQW